MNKHIINALKDYDFAFEKNTAYGHISGYEVNVVTSMYENGPILYISTNLTSAQKNEFIVKLNAAKIALLRAEPFDYGIVIVVGAMTYAGVEKKCAKALPLIIELLESMQAPKGNICPQSGVEIDETNSKLSTISVGMSKVKVRLSNDAVAAINSGVEKANEEFNNAPNNYLKGFWGILIGAVAGALLTIILEMVGFIAAFSSIVAIFLGIFLYKKFGGKANAVMVIMSFVTTIVVILGMLTLIYIYLANAMVKEAELTYKGFEALSYCIKTTPKFASSFYGDLAMNGLFILLGEGFSLGGALKMIRRPQTVK